ncbi:MAG: phosphopyruvate hydratase [Candidatus Diapherotrites archaeon]
MSKIVKIKARQVLDSRGNPTIEAEVHTKRFISCAIVPSGASRGSLEALELRDNEKDYLGQSVLKAVSNVNKVIAQKLIGMDVKEQKRIDRAMIELDGTPNKSKLGANAILAVSLAVARNGALCSEMPLFEYLAELIKNKLFSLPVPAFNMINGGAHASNNLSIQEFLLYPIDFKSFSDALRCGSEIHHELKKIIIKKHGKSDANYGDEGGFAPNLRKTTDAFELILEAARELGYEKKVKLGIDAAASQFYKNKRYVIEGMKLKSEELVHYYLELKKAYPMLSFEDPFAEEDWNSFIELNKKTGEKILVIGDDLFVSRADRIKKAVDLKACNALLLKVNQVGTLSEALESAQTAFNGKWRVMVSHRSGETEDSFIADLAVGINSGLIKTGAPCRGERTAKFNQLLRIEEELTAHNKALYAGIHF